MGKEVGKYSYTEHILCLYIAVVPETGYPYLHVSAAGVLLIVHELEA